MINIFTAVVIALASSALGFLVGWLFGRAKDGNKPVEHVERIMYSEPSERRGSIITIYD